jgi:hypothetical protein
MSPRLLKAAALALAALAGSARSASAQAPPPSQATPVRVGSFSIYAAADPITDQDRTSAEVSTADSTSLLGFQCFGDTAEMFVVTQGKPVGDQVDVVFRFDQDAADTATVDANVQDEDTWLWFPADLAFPLVQRALTARRFVLRTYSADMVATDRIFDLVDGSRALRRLACISSPRPAAMGDPARKPAAKPRG